MIYPYQLTWADLGETYDGPHATPRRVNSGPYFLNISSLSGGHLDLTQSDHVTSEEFAKWTRRVTPQADDLLFSYETRLGEAALMPGDIEACLGRRMALLRPNRDVVHPRFMLYYYLSPAFQRLIEQNTIYGATVNRISLSTIGKWPVAIPCLKVQQATAEVLGALDDKIAANIKISQSSNHLANALFRQTLRDAEFSNDTFADLAQVSGGGTPSTKNPNFWDGEVPWATPTDITSLTGPYLESTSRFISDAGLNACASGLYPQGSILMTSRATIGAFAMAQKPTAVNQGFIVVQPHDPELRYWLFHEMQSRVDEFVSLANGATFLELSRGNFKKFKVRQAPLDIMRKFNEQATALHDTARSALTENLTLAATRDALLPQLMSGKLRIKDAEELVGPRV